MSDPGQGASGRGVELLRAQVGEDLERVHAVLRAEVERQEWSIRALAGETGLGQPRLHRWLHGERDSIQLDALLALVRGLGRDLGWLGRRMREAG